MDHKESADILQRELGLKGAIEYARSQVFMARTNGSALLEDEYQGALNILLDRALECL